ncbi:hypothetical protein BRADI_5g24235v3 [Brachypodium distachyon]|uniref:Uncharacterized protein n=1 Tax=Brachypodium distachyon TaxID=15368 RepID=A0A2K2CJ17_BRADI|nr:hypothetical protein BRADI_5g24235v3 [Brachypodium distachyon]
MARLPLNARSRRRNLRIRLMMSSLVMMYYYVWLMFFVAYRRRCLKIERRIRNRSLRAQRLFEMIHESDKAVLKLHSLLLEKPEPIPEDSDDPK